MTFISEKDIENRKVFKGLDFLSECLRLRQELKWENTVLTELYAFISYAISYPDYFLALVDSFNTLKSGVKNFLLVALCLKKVGHEPTGIRLDSGDLAELSKQSRKLIDETGKIYGYDFSNVKIVASNDINEETLASFKENGHKIDIFGIGTNLVTCQSQPALGMVYKLVSINDEPRIKISEELEKISLPGAKSILRIYEGEKNEPFCDLVCFDYEVEELKNQEKIKCFKALTDDLVEVEHSEIEVLTKLLIEKNEVKTEIGTISVRREKQIEEFLRFGGYEKLIEQKKKFEFPVYLSEKLNKKFKDLVNEYNL